MADRAKEPHTAQSGAVDVYSLSTQTPMDVLPPPRLVRPPQQPATHGLENPYMETGLYAVPQQSYLPSGMIAPMEFTLTNNALPANHSPPSNMSAEPSTDVYYAGSSQMHYGADYSARIWTAAPSSPVQARADSPESSAGSHCSGISHPPGSRSKKRAPIFANQSSDVLLESVERWDDGNAKSSGPSSTAMVGTVSSSKNVQHSGKLAASRVRKHSQNEKLETGEKRVGKLKGLWKLEQRRKEQILRSVNACLRCKFIRKACDKGNPCTRCRSSYVRQWQMPCTRLSIKDLGYFIQDWQADNDIQDSIGFSIKNIMGYHNDEKSLNITHGYGYVLPISARQYYIGDYKKCLSRWANRFLPQENDNTHYTVDTAKLFAGMEGIPQLTLSEYIDHHLDEEDVFQRLAHDMFERRPFVMQVLMTIFRYHKCTGIRAVSKALKLYLTYNLTFRLVFVVESICIYLRTSATDTPRTSGTKIVPAMVNLRTAETNTPGTSGMKVAPAMVNLQMNHAIADMWRGLHKSVLEDLDSLYTSVHNAKKPTIWPTILIQSFILLAMWEELQFDCPYGKVDPRAAESLSKEIESISVNVLIGMFRAISQNLPALKDWDTEKHHHLVDYNPEVCQMLTEIGQHIHQFENYLKFQADAKFDSNDFATFSDKFISNLVLQTKSSNPGQNQTLTKSMIAVEELISI